MTETLVVWLPDTFMRRGCDLLDAMVIAELMRPNPNSQVPAWTDGLDPAQTAIKAMNEAEILHGIVRLPRRGRKRALQESWDVLLPALFDGRVWAFNHETAHRYGELLSRREQLGQPIATADAVIAATTWPRTPSWLPATWPNSQGSAWC